MTLPGRPKSFKERYLALSVQPMQFVGCAEQLSQIGYPYPSVIAIERTGHQQWKQVQSIRGLSHPLKRILITASISGVLSRMETAGWWLTEATNGYSPVCVTFMKPSTGPIARRMGEGMCSMPGSTTAKASAWLAWPERNPSSPRSGTAFSECPCPRGYPYALRPAMYGRAWIRCIRGHLHPCGGCLYGLVQIRRSCRTNMELTAAMADSPICGCST